MPGQVFFIGDLHLGHHNIMGFGQRKFETIGEHDAHLLQQWNSVVRKQADIVWVLGDVAMSREAMKLLSAMNGTKHLVLGNHDQCGIREYQKYFDKIVGVEKKYGVVMTHVPIHPGELEYRSWQFNLHGHCHNLANAPDDPRYINVCADAIGLTPISLVQVRTILEERQKLLQAKGAI
jgi:calcineurin-like phosphoesterase family protein